MLDVNNTGHQGTLYNDYEEEENDEEEDNYEIDNTDLEYLNGSLYIRLNDKRNFYEERQHKLDFSRNTLLKNYPLLKKIESDDILQTILEEVFAEGFNMQMYIRNLSFTLNNGRDVKILGIRPEKHEDAGFLYDYFPKGVSLLFKGHMNGFEFVIDSIHETADSDRLDYEVAAEARPFHTNIPQGNKHSFLYDVLEEAESLTEHTEEKLKEWESYLAWRKELARRQVHGCKYYKITFDEDKKRIVFWLVCESSEEFKAFRKYLYRDIQVFNNDYSEDRWKFRLRRETGKKRQFDKSIELGRCRGIVEEYYLEGAPEENENAMDANLEQSEAAIDYDGYDYNDDYDDEYEESGNNGINFANHFKHPYIVKVAFDLSRSDMDEISEKNIDDDEINGYINENIIGNYYEQGFLALSAVGDFVLISRLENAISQLKRDESFSPNLALWIFNVIRARLPQGDYEKDISKWLNKNIESNEDQKNAVYKMLNAPDLCLIQGPPGTGKTTVIAEAIYQFVKNGNRVLVASQSNDAVDNALERLAETPEIRAIRFGQKGRRKRKNEDLSKRKFSEDEALKYFYNSLSNQISETWLDKWDNLEKLNDEYLMEIRDVKLFQKDVVELSLSLNNVTLQCDEKKREKNVLLEKLNASRAYNANYINEQIQFKNFCDFFSQISEDSFYLNAEQLKIVERNINLVLNYLMEKGIYLASSSLNLDLLGTKLENEYVLYALKAYLVLRGLATRMKNCDNTKNADANTLIITRKIAEIDDKMNDEEDDDIILQLVKEKRNLKKQLDDLNTSTSAIEFTSVENSVLSVELKNQINNSSSIINEAKKLEALLDKFKSAIRSTISEMEACIKCKKEINTDELIEKVEVAESQYEGLRLHKEEYKKNLDAKRLTLINLSKKYNLNTNDGEIIIKYIEELREANNKKLHQEKLVRDDWEATLKAFKGRLNDKESFKYDKEYYQKIYVNACNVVGISCTDNMRNLTDKGYNDFDVVIIDEVSKATPPELLIPLMKGRKAILVGDHRQLPPMFNEHEKSYNELIKNQDDILEEVRDLMTVESFSRFKNMVTASLFKDYFENADKSIKHSLFTQYRMHSDIMDIINRFYERHLNKGLSDYEENAAKNHGLTIKGVDGDTFIRPNRHAYWIDSSLLPSGKKFFETRPEGSTSAENLLEQHIIIELLKKMAAFYKEAGFNKDNPKTVGIISFYQLQVNSIRERFKNERKKFDFSAIQVDINTVDRFQGKEKQIIITSLVRNPVKAYRSEGSHIAAFERINVAFSRAQELLVIIGSKEMYEKQPVKLPNMDTVGETTVFVYQNIIDDLNIKSCFMYSSKIIDAQLEKDILSEYKKEYGGKK